MKKLLSLIAVLGLFSFSIGCESPETTAPATPATPAGDADMGDDAKPDEEGDEKGEVEPKE